MGGRWGIDGKRGTLEGLNKLKANMGKESSYKPFFVDEKKTPQRRK